MIVPMKKISLLCLESDRHTAMEQLRDLGIMHVDLAARTETPDVLTLTSALQEGTAFYNILSGYRDPECPVSAPEQLPGKEICRLCREKLERKEVFEKEILSLKNRMEQLLPWGDFKQETLALLEKEQIHILFCSASRNVYNTLTPEEGTLKVLVSSVKEERYFLLISTERLDETLYPAVKLPPEALSDVQQTLIAAQEELSGIENSLKVLASSLDSLKEYLLDLEAEREFVSNRDGMESDGTIACIHGYVPAGSLETLRASAKENAWALTADDPDVHDERVPTCLKHPRWLKVIEPLFDFIGITPGYRESDVALFFLIAFPVFFGMLIGDTGYGLLFFITALLCKYITREKEQMRLPLNLLLILSSCSMIWGLLTGAFFSIPRNSLPCFLQGLDFLAAPGESPAACALAKKLHIADPGELTNKFVQWFCFLLAGLHLSSARLYKCFSDLRNWRSWGHLGWVCVIWANFLISVDLIVFPGTFPKALGITLYIVGFLMIAGTTTAEGALNLPSALVGSFVDVLSYIRLFAVGLSGVYVGSCFNDMGLMLMNALPKYLTILGVIGLILVAMTGHILNILLGIMGVMVHAIRLNTLEFSNHIEMQWTGIAYRPFARKKK